MINLDKYRVERGVKLKSNQLMPNDYNPNKTTERVDEAIKESLNHYGQVLEILVRPHPTEKDKFIIVDGEHRFNFTDKEVYCNIIHDLSEDDTKKLTIILNETRGKADLLELSEILALLEDSMGAEDLKIGLPYTEKELQDLINQAEEIKEEDLEEEHQPSLDETTPIKCPSCGHEFIKN